MWAWYQLVASWAVYQKTVPKAKKTVVAKRTAVATGSRPSAHQQSAMSIGGEDREDRLVIGGQAPDRDERNEDEPRQRRERQEAARDAVGRRDRQDVLEVAVPDRRRTLGAG